MFARAGSIVVSLILAGACSSQACVSPDSRIDACAHHHHLLLRATQLARLGALLAAERNLAAMNPKIGNQVAGQMAQATALASNPDITVQAANFANINAIEQEIRDN